VFYDLKLITDIGDTIYTHFKELLTIMFEDLLLNFVYLSTGHPLIFPPDTSGLNFYPSK